MDEYVKKLHAQLKANGIATGLCGNGDRIFMLSKDKLTEIMRQLNESGNEAAVILIQNPDRIN